MDIIIKLADYFKNDPPLLFAFLVCVFLAYILVKLLTNYKGLLETQTRIVALIDVLVFNKKNGEKSPREDA
jgi:hypothetical protein